MKAGTPTPAVLFISFARVPAHADLVTLQREHGKRRADELGLRLVHEIVEMGASAVASKNRFAIQALCNYLDDHPNVRHVVFPHIGRVARTRRDYKVIQEQLKKRSVVIVTADGLLSGDDDPQRKLFDHVLLSLAEQDTPNHRRSRSSRRTL
ncbi:recombinase family protein [Nocardia sp. alder85J]|uniref:recombinase family protein n=1 Tax=Nocardia sp. alder85J TaxID=2862949 RepID=UPI001CD36EC1